MDKETVIKNLRQIANQNAIFDTNKDIKHLIFHISYILQVILMFMQLVVMFMIPPGISDVILLIFPISILIIGLIEDYMQQEINQKLEMLEDKIDFNTTERINPGFFNGIISELDTEKKYHICRELDSEGYIKNWSIYRKDMDIEEYFSDDNIPLLDSTSNSIGDLIVFVAHNKE